VEKIMRFLADENCDFTVIRALRAHGHDVVSVSDISPRAEDSEVINLAAREERILLTEDKDFGQLVYAHAQETLGVIFLRFPISARRQRGFG
jgi:predicted nuclease of predicted toxin-antitoxin system